MELKSLIHAYNEYILKDSDERTRANLHAQIDVFSGKLENTKTKCIWSAASFNEAVVCLTTLLNEKKLSSSNLPYKILQILFKIASEKSLIQIIWNPLSVSLSILSHLNTNSYDKNDHIFYQCLRILDLTSDHITYDVYVYYLLSEIIKACVDLIFSMQEDISMIALSLMSNIARKDSSKFFNYFVSSWSLTRIKNFCRILLKYFECSNKKVILSSLMLYLTIACRSSPEINKAFLTTDNISQAIQIIFANIAPKKDSITSLSALKLMNDIIQIPVVNHFFENYEHIEDCLEQTFKVITSPDSTIIHQTILSNYTTTRSLSQPKVFKNQRLIRICKRKYYECLFASLPADAELRSSKELYKYCQPMIVDEMETSFEEIDHQARTCHTKVTVKYPNFLMFNLVKCFERLLIPQYVLGGSSDESPPNYFDLNGENVALLSNGGMVDFIANLINDKLQPAKTEALTLLRGLWDVVGRYLGVMHHILSAQTPDPKCNLYQDEGRFMKCLLARLHRICPLIIALYTSMNDTLRPSLSDINCPSDVFGETLSKLWELSNGLLLQELSNFKLQKFDLAPGTTSNYQYYDYDLKRLMTECCLFCCHVASHLSCGQTPSSNNGHDRNFLLSVFGLNFPFDGKRSDREAFTELDPELVKKCQARALPWVTQNLSTFLIKSNATKLIDSDPGTLIKICVELAIRVLNNRCDFGVKAQVGDVVEGASRQLLDLTSVSTATRTDNTVSSTVPADPLFWTFDQNNAIEDTYARQNGYGTTTFDFDFNASFVPPRRALGDASHVTDLTTNHSAYEMGKDGPVADLLDIYESREVDNKLRQNCQNGLISVHAILIQQLQDQLNLLQGTNIKNEAQFSKYRHVISLLEDEKCAFREEIRDLEASLQKLANALKGKENEMRGLVRDVEEGKTNLSSEISRRESVQKTLEAVRMECNTLKEMHQVLQRHHEQSKSQQEALDQQIVSLENENSKLTKDTKDRDAKIAELAQGSQNLGELLDRSEKENEKLHLALEQMRREVTKVDEARKKLAMEKSSLEALCRQQESALVEKDDTNKKLKNDLMLFTEITSKINHLTMDLKPRH